MIRVVTSTGEPCGREQDQLCISPLGWIGRSYPLIRTGFHTGLTAGCTHRGVGNFPSNIFLYTSL